MQYISGTEAAQRLNWKIGRVRRLLFLRRENGLDCATVKIGKSLLIDFDGFLRWIEAHREVKLNDSQQQ